jgi:hypothetical protein
MYTQFEKYCWGASFWLLIWSIPQYALTFWFITDHVYLAKMFNEPMVAVAVWTITSFLIVHMAFRFVGRELPDNLREAYREDYYEYVPWLFKWPPMQFHAATVMIFRMSIITIVRIFVKGWRRDDPRLF